MSNSCRRGTLAYIVDDRAYRAQLGQAKLKVRSCPESGPIVAVLSIHEGFSCTSAIFEHELVNPTPELLEPLLEMVGYRWFATVNVLFDDDGRVVGIAGIRGIDDSNIPVFLMETPVPG